MKIYVQSQWRVVLLWYHRFWQSSIQRGRHTKHCIISSPKQIIKICSKSYCWISKIAFYSPRDANLLRKEKSIFEDEKKYFGLKNSIFHFVSIEVYTKWSLKKKVVWGILLKITSICNLKKVLNTAKKEQLASLLTQSTLLFGETSPLTIFCDVSSRYCKMNALGILSCCIHIHKAKYQSV